MKVVTIPSYHKIQVGWALGIIKEKEDFEWYWVITKVKGDQVYLEERKLTREKPYSISNRSLEVVQQERATMKSPNYFVKSLLRVVEQSPHINWLSEHIDNTNVSEDE